MLREACHNSNTNSDSNDINRPPLHATLCTHTRLPPPLLLLLLLPPLLRLRPPSLTAVVSPGLAQKWQKQSWFCHD